MYASLLLAPFLISIILNLFFISRTGLKKASLWVAVGVSVAQMYLVLMHSAYCWNSSLYMLSNFFKFPLTVDAMSRVVLFSIGIVAFVALLVGNYLIKNGNETFNFANLILILLAGMNGIAMVKDIFSLYMFLEVVAVVSFILIASHKNIAALEGAFKYIILSTVATVLMLSSIALFMLVSGSTDFSVIHTALSSSPHNFLVNGAIGLFICGLFIKAGLVPFHGWLPDAYSEAPAAVSVLLAGVVTKTAGVYTLMRVVYSVFGFVGPLKSVLMGVGLVSIVVGALASLGQNDFKRMLAYSSISQVGYIILGFGCGTALGIAGSLFHLFNHAIFKSLLFINAAAVEAQTGTRDMDKMSGLGSRMPVTGITSVLASLSTAGIPPLSGFWSKLLIVIALWSSGNRLYAGIAILASIITLAYFLSMQRRVFFGKAQTETSKIREVGFGMAFPAVVLAAIIVGVGLLFPLMLPALMSRIGILFGG